MSTLLALLALTARPEALLRLQLQPGDQFDYSLAVQRPDPSQSGVLREHVVITKVAGPVTTMKISLVGLSMNGQDRSRDLRTLLGRQQVVMSWTNLAQRAGAMSGPSLPQNVDPKLMGLISEAGLYLCDFPARTVAPGDTWSGATTATGGCTSATYRLKAIGKALVYVELTEIAMRDSEQVGPMRMTVCTTTGLPKDVTYTARNNRTGRESQFQQKLISFTRAPESGRQ